MKIVDEGFENLGDPSWLRIEGLIKRLRDLKQREQSKWEKAKLNDSKARIKGSEYQPLSGLNISKIQMDSFEKSEHVHVPIYQCLSYLQYFL